MWRGFASLVLTLSFIVPAGAAAAADEATVTFVGAGWGHGLGLSQYGAYGASRDGWTAEQITEHFYQGSEIKTLGVDLDEADDLWVSLDRDVEILTLIARKINYLEPPGPTAAVVVQQGTESWEMAVDEKLVIDRIADTRNCALTFATSAGAEIRSVTGTCDINIDWDGDTEKPTRKIETYRFDDDSVCTFADWNGSEANYPAATEYRPCQYGRGHMVIRAPGDGSTGPFDVTVILDLEDYMLGISEMPYYWGLDQNGGMAALEAQVLAARSYARELQIVRGTPGSNSCGGWCHVRDDTTDQRYVGWGQGWSTWIEAVDATANQVLAHPDAPNGTVVRAYYSSSSGGFTENVHEVSSAYSQPVEYLSSVDDHWALTSINPHRSWEKTFSAGYVADVVWGSSRDVALQTVQVTERYTSTSAKTVVFTGIENGQTVTETLSGTSVDSKFGLRSKYFDVVFGDPVPPSPFNDIGGSVHYDDILYIAELGITKGCNPPSNSQFCPDDNVTRGEMAAFLVRALGLTDGGGKDWFADDDGTIFEGDINKLAAAGITSGCNGSGTEYCPNAPATRGEMAAFLVRAFGYDDPGQGDWFTDDDDSMFEGNIDRLKVAGVTVGCNPPTNDRFCPVDRVQRDQMASFLARALRGQDA